LALPPLSRWLLDPGFFFDFVSMVLGPILFKFIYFYMAFGLFLPLDLSARSGRLPSPAPIINPLRAAGAVACRTAGLTFFPL